MRNKYLLIVFLLALSLSGFAQQTFSTDKATFLEEMTAYLGSSTSKNDREEALAMMTGFTDVWNGYYNASDAKAVAEICETLHKRSGQRAYYNIFTFVDVLHHLPVSGLSHPDIYNWLCYTNGKCSKSASGFDKYIAACRTVFVDKILCEKGNSKWEMRDVHFGFPEKENFVLTLTNTTLALKSNKDESLIHNANGVYSLDDKIFTGNGGRVDWARFDIPTDVVYADLPAHYVLNLTHSDYVIDSVVFHDKKYFQDAILCQFEDKVLVNAPNEKTMYPRVKSYRSDYYIKDIMKDVDFNGGLGMMGNQVDVFGGVDKKAVFIFFKNRKKVVTVQAPRFLMSMDEVLASDRASVRFYLNDTISGRIGQDSIYHNGLDFRYENQKRKMIMLRSQKGYPDAPFHDNFHDLDIYLESMSWVLDNNIVEFSRMEGIGNVSEGDVVSVNYFSFEDFAKLRGLDGTNPLIRIEKFLNEYRNPDNPDFFYVGDLCNYLKFPVEQVVSLLLRLQSEAYLEYDAETKTAVVLQRFYDAIESYRENIDYDVIKLHTVTTNREPNIRLDLNTNELIVFGIKSTIEGLEGSAISLSDRKRVVIVPDNGRLVFKKDRDFRFSGGIIAGMFEFFAKDCLFNYEDFMIEMSKVDSLRFYARGDGQIIPVDGTIEKLQGRLLIDHGNNKSSRYETPDFPKFYSDANAYKFYRHINKGVFNPGNVDSLATADDLAGKFYYYLYPFEVDSLTDLTMQNVSFNGELVSGGIFPRIEEPLVVMDDYSLGFDHRIGATDNDSYPMYDGSGRFHQHIHLSSDGFYGVGSLDYQTAAFNSERFVFYLDSVTAITNQFKMQPLADGTKYPVASASALKMKWDVFKPELTTETIDNPICMYGDTYFRGKTTLNADGYKADGKMKYGLTEFESEDFALDSRTFVADSAKFVLYSADSTTVAFAATNYRADVNFDSQKVQYDYLDQTSNLDFPMNKFVCTLKEAEWDMATNSLHVYNPVDGNDAYSKANTHDELLAVHDNASKFISMIPEQDSLEFYSTSAEYDMTNYVIHAHDVKIIRVADAAVFPYEHDIDIDSDSQLEPISGELLADTLNGFHLYKNALVNIKSRRNYKAQGTWDYAALDGSHTPIYFDSIVPVNGMTHAFAHLVDSAEFQLSPQFAFEGDLTLKAGEEFGFFDGHFALLDFGDVADSLSFSVDDMMESDSSFVAMPSSGDLLEPVIAEKNWFASAARINPNKIEIPIAMDTIKKDDPDMFNGLYYEQAIDGGYFASFLTPNKRPVEMTEVAPANGTLSFDSDSLRFVITDENLYDTYLYINRRGVVSGHGTFDLGFDKGLTDFVCRGSYTNYPNDSLTLDVLNVLNVPVIDDKVLEGIAEVYANMEGESIDLTKTAFVDYFRSENDEEKTDEFVKTIELEGYPKMGSRDFYNKTIVIPDLKMVWNDKLHAFISVGKIGLGNLGSHIVNKYVDGYVVFDHRLGNITYYFVNDLFMTYINYNCGDGQLQIHATYGDINQRLYDLKEKSRSYKRDDKTFNYVATPYDALLNFLNNLKYAGVE